MSDERKEMLKALNYIWFYYSGDFPTDDISEQEEKIQQIRHILQHQPERKIEIDEKYVDGKVMELYRLEFTTGQAKKFITQIVSDVKGIK